MARRIGGPFFLSEDLEATQNSTSFSQNALSEVAPPDDIWASSR